MPVEGKGIGSIDPVVGLKSNPRVNPEQSTCLHRMPGVGPSRGQSRDELSRLRFCSFPLLLKRVVVMVWVASLRKVGPSSPGVLVSPRMLKRVFVWTGPVYTWR